MGADLTDDGAHEGAAQARVTRVGDSHLLPHDLL